MPPKAKKPAVHYIAAVELQVVDVPNKGKGVVAAIDLPRNSRLPYLGKQIDQKTYDNFAARNTKHPEKRYVDYIIATSIKGTYIDAHPRYRGSEKWIASRINEPGPRQKANCVIRFEERLPVVVTTKKIAAGQELMLHYGGAYERQYRVGQRADKPAWLR